MSLYSPETVTLWVIQTDSPTRLSSLFEFSYDEEDDENDECSPSPFARAYRLPWYDEDFTALESGDSAKVLLKAMSEWCRTLDEQALPRLPEGDWNGIYLVFSGAGEEWKSPETRPPMPHGFVTIEGATFRLVDTFHTVLRPR